MSCSEPTPLGLPQAAGFGSLFHGVEGCWNASFWQGAQAASLMIRLTLAREMR